jgi:hypothetical protein
MRLLHPECLYGTSRRLTHLFASAWSLFVVSLHSFLHLFPLFSIVCSLFYQNTRVGGYQDVYEETP